jgi:hypothetical protein
MIPIPPIGMVISHPKPLKYAKYVRNDAIPFDPIPIS